jgi:hypothetical protein
VEISPSEHPLPAPDQGPLAPPAAAFRLPADYYAAPPDGRAILPRWVPVGCGLASLAVLAAIFAGGAVLMRGGGFSIVSWALSAVRTDVDKAMGPDVPAADRAALDREMDALRKNLEGGRIKLDRVRPILMSLQRAAEDDKITLAEARQLTKQMHDVNSGAKAPPQ